MFLFVICHFFLRVHVQLLVCIQFLIIFLNVDVELKSYGIITIEQSKPSQYVISTFTQRYLMMECCFNAEITFLPAGIERHNSASQGYVVHASGNIKTQFILERKLGICKN